MSDGSFTVALRDTRRASLRRIRARLSRSSSRRIISATERKGGTGLGLSIAKRIIGMRAAVSGSSRKSEGLTFSFTIPVTVSDRWAKHEQVHSGG